MERNSLVEDLLSSTEILLKTVNKKQIIKRAIGKMDKNELQREYVKQIGERRI